MTRALRFLRWNRYARPAVDFAACLCGGLVAFYLAWDHAPAFAAWVFCVAFGGPLWWLGFRYGQRRGPFVPPPKKRGPPRPPPRPGRLLIR